MGILSAIKDLVAIIRDILIIIVLLAVIVGMAYVAMIVPQLGKMMSGSSTLIQGMVGGQGQQYIYNQGNKSNGSYNPGSVQQEGGNFDPYELINKVSDPEIKSLLQQVASDVDNQQDNEQIMTSIDALISKLSEKGLTTSVSAAQNFKDAMNAENKTAAEQDFKDLISSLTTSK